MTRVRTKTEPQVRASSSDRCLVAEALKLERRRRAEAHAELRADPVFQRLVKEDACSGAALEAGNIAAQPFRLARDKLIAECHQKSSWSAKNSRKIEALSRAAHDAQYKALAEGGCGMRQPPQSPAEMLAALKAIQLDWGFDLREILNSPSPMDSWWKDAEHLVELNPFLPPLPERPNEGRKRYASLTRWCESCVRMCDTSGAVGSYMPIVDPDHEIRLRFATWSAERLEEFDPSEDPILYARGWLHCYQYRLLEADRHRHFPEATQESYERMLKWADDPKADRQREALDVLLDRIRQHPRPPYSPEVLLIEFDRLFEIPVYARLRDDFTGRFEAWIDRVETFLKIGSGVKEKDSPLVSDDALLSPAQLLKQFGLPDDQLNALNKRLQRFRRKNLDGYIENTEAQRREARYLYKVGAVRQILEAMVAKSRAANM